MKLILLGDSARQFERPILDRFPRVEAAVVAPRDTGTADLRGVHCAIGWKFPDGLFERLPDLRWVQSISVGVDNWVYDSTMKSDVIVTNTKGLYATEVAEYICWAMLTLSRRYHEAMHNQHKRRWLQLAGRSLAGKTVGIAGMGAVGCAAAKNARALGMRVVGLCRSTDSPRAKEVADAVISTQDMTGALGELDFLVVCLPVTNQTRGLFGQAEIAALKPGAILVNAARESIVDYRAVTDALKSGHLAGAALDVFEKEPLPRRSSLWKNDNIIVTPHVGAFTKEYKAKVSDLICENIGRFLAGQPLRCVVDRGKGY